MWIRAIGVLVLLGLLAPEARGAETVRTYRASGASFANPERGFVRSYPDALAEPLEDHRREGVTVVRATFRLDEHRTTEALPPAYLERVAGYLAEARRRHLKVIVRFAYNHSADGPDASAKVTTAHIRRLGPVLEANRDSVAYVEAGFAGAWGEWHSGSNGHVDGRRELNPGGRAILQSLLAEFPGDRAIALRYPVIKQRMFGGAPLTAAEALTAAPKARLGFHNDCFLADATDGGTWDDSSDDLQRYVSADARFVPVGGETCEIAGVQDRYVTCPNATLELERQRWSHLNLDWYAPALDVLREQGCFEEIERRLGYRLRLVSARLPAAARAGGRLRLDLEIANDGYAAPYAKRPVRVVLRRADGTERTLTSGADPRRWLPGETTTERLEVDLPAELPAGDYALALELPDPLRPGEPAESIRLANEGVWEPATATNALGAMVTVAAPGSASELVLHRFRLQAP
jgi:hypothetical protein